MKAVTGVISFQWFQLHRHRRLSQKPLCMQNFESLWLICLHRGSYAEAVPSRSSSTSVLLKWRAGPKQCISLTGEFIKPDRDTARCLCERWYTSFFEYACPIWCLRVQQGEYVIPICRHLRYVAVAYFLYFALVTSALHKYVFCIFVDALFIGLQVLQYYAINRDSYWFSALMLLTQIVV